MHMSDGSSEVSDASVAGSKVLAFYSHLAFNRHGSAQAQAASIRKHDAIDSYPVLRPLLRRGAQVLDVGCGTGWFANGMRLRYPAAVTGIDFNPAATAFAEEVAESLAVDTDFETANLFTYDPGRRFDVITSIGALHHTGDCHGAIRRIAADLLAPGGHFFIGLYHRHGRAPFLEHFEALRADGADEEALFERYRRLHPRSTDETHLRSWFRDQVLHPHETQHTLAEMLPVLSSAGLVLTSTSLNAFAPIKDLSAVLAAEPAMRDLAVQRLQQGRYFPGFFLMLVRKGSAA